MNSSDRQSEICALERAEGVVAYAIAGAGPLVVCVPGMGDLRSSYRYLQPLLLLAGFRVAVMDLRGHGDSDMSFTEYGDAETASDIAALIEQVGGPALIVGNSMAAASAVLVAAQRPDLVNGLVLIGPFVRERATSALMRLATRTLMARPWAASVWSMYLPRLYAGTRPDDFAGYRRAIATAMKRPGYGRAFSRTTRTRHDAASDALHLVSAPVLVVMGELDPDFADPSGEAGWIADQLHGEILMVPNAGHYPQSQRPDLVGPAVTKFARRLAGAPRTGASR